MKLFAKLLFFAVLLIGIWNYKLLNYFFSQAKGQIKVSWNAENIDEIIERLPASDSLSLQLKLVLEIKKFAEDSLGLKKSDNYLHYYDQKGHTLMWMLMAAEPFEMKSYEWNYPLFGNFAYKGFFDKKKAEEENLELKQKGYDTEIGKAGGWSTLGWFKDPVLSNMLNASTGRLAELLIHELTHGTMYVKNNVDFNENLASCIGEKGSEMFLQHKYGLNSKELINYKLHVTDDKIFEAYVYRCSHELIKLYKKIEKFSSQDKLRCKRQMIARMVKDVEGLSLKDNKKYRKRMKQALASGNAFFLNYARYDFQKDSLKGIIESKYNGNVKEFIVQLNKQFVSL